MFNKNMCKYNCKVYDMCVIVYLNDQGREIVCLIEPNASFYYFFSRKCIFKTFFPYQIQKNTNL